LRKITRNSINNCDFLKCIIYIRGSNRDYSPRVPKEPSYATAAKVSCVRLVWHCQKRSAVHYRLSPTYPTVTLLCVHRKAEWAYTWSIINAIIFKAAQLKYKLHHTVTLSATAWPSWRLCYRPSVFYRHLRLTALPFPQGKIRCAFQKCYYIYCIYPPYSIF